MTEPDPDEVKHEIEMGAEEFLGHALPGNPAERIATLEKRLEYLKEEIVHCDFTELSRLRSDLARAEQLLAHFKTQHDGRN